MVLVLAMCRVGKLIALAGDRRFLHHAAPGGDPFNPDDTSAHVAVPSAKLVRPAEPKELVLKSPASGITRQGAGTFLACEGVKL